MAYTYAQLEQIWINAGGSRSTAPMAAAIAWAESSGNPQATSPNPDGGTNVGLWQLDTPGGGGAGFSASQLADPTVNAAAAVRASNNGTNWSTWETYATGAYKGYLSPGTTPDSNVPTATLTAATVAASAASTSTCLIGFTTPSVLGIGGGTVCLLSKANMRSIIGAGLITGAGFIVLVSAVLIVGIGLKQEAVKQVAGPVGKLVRTPAGRSSRSSAGGSA